MLFRGKEVAMKIIKPLKSKEEMNVFRLIRLARNLKVKDVASELGVSSAYINAIENGERYPSERLLRDYAIVLGVDEEVITTFKPEKQRSSKFEHVLLSLLKMISDIDNQ